MSQHSPGSSLDDRRQALEDAFFEQRNRDLIAASRAEKAAEQEQEALGEVTGIQSTSLLERLIGHGVNADTLVALSLIPLVTVAWADEELEDEERDAILKAASEAGVAEGSGSAKLLTAWLRKKPGPELVATWRDYVGSLIVTLDESEVEELKQEVLQRAHDVAFAAGGFLGIGAINPREKRALEELSSAFEA